jgi:hypothetical protein
MLKTEILKNFLNKKILIIYKDTDKVCKLKGFLRDVSENSLTIETWYNWVIINESQILKLKLPLQKSD